MSSDFSYVLSRTDGYPLNKSYARRPEDWTWVRKDVPLPTTFRAKRVKISSFSGLVDFVTFLTRCGNACVIRGDLRSGVDATEPVNRCFHRQPDGREPDWDFADPGHRWVCFDIDKLPFRPPRSATSERAVEYAIAAIRDALPEAFEGASHVIRFSPSFGLNGDWDTVSAHVWFWMDRPVHDLSLREWCKVNFPAADTALFSPVQIHYTANPTFEGYGVGDGDPVFAPSQRLVTVRGTSETVKAPDELLGARAWRSRVAELRERTQAERSAKVKSTLAGVKRGDGSQTRAYAKKMLEGCVDDILAAPEGMRHSTLVTKAFKLGGLLGSSGGADAGPITYGEVSGALEAAVTHTFPPERWESEQRTISQMLDRGADSPLDLSHVGTKPSQRRQTLDGKPMPNFPHIDDNGRILNTTDNYEALFKHLGFRARKNVMTGESMWVDRGGNKVRDLDVECAALDLAELSGWRMRVTEVRRIMKGMEEDDLFSPVEEWSRVAWDGVPRFEVLFKTLEVNPEFEQYTELFFKQLTAWLIGGGRCLNLPADAADGIASDGVLVLQGAQGNGKTRWVRSLVPDSAWVRLGLTLDPANKDSVMKATTPFIVEMGELDATTRKADVAALKSFLTDSVDVYRAPYAAKSEAHPRRTIFAGTVNPKQFLKDQTGNRRMWVIPVLRTNPEHGIDMQQVWAEARHRAKAGEPSWLDSEAFEQQKEAVQSYNANDGAIEDMVYLVEKTIAPDPDSRVHLAELRAAMKPNHTWTNPQHKTLALALEKAGFERGKSHKGAYVLAKFTRKRPDLE